LEEFVDQVETGESFIITRDGQPIVEMVAVDASPTSGMVAFAA